MKIILTFLSSIYLMIQSVVTGRPMRVKPPAPITPSRAITPHKPTPSVFFNQLTGQLLSATPTPTTTVQSKEEIQDIEEIEDIPLDESFDDLPDFDVDLTFE